MRISDWSSDVCSSDLVEVGEQYVGGLAELDREAGVEHVARRHALVHEARFVADILGDPGQEGDDVVLGDRLDRVDRGDVDRGARCPPVPQRLGGGFRDGAEFGERVGRVRFDLEPDAKAILGRPYRGRSEEHTSELQSLMRISYAVFCLKNKKIQNT